VIKEADAQQVAHLLEAFGEVSVFLTRSDITLRVVVGDDDRGGILEDGQLHHFPRMG